MKKKKKNQKSNMLKEFKEFALKGNIIDMAIGVVIGGAFQKIVNSLVNDIIMPLISILIGKVDFSDMVLTVGNASIKYGSFITTIVDFLIIAFSIFIAIKYFNKLNKIKDISEEMAVKLDKKGNVKKYIKEKKKEENKEPETKICPYCLTEIKYHATRCPNCTSELVDENAKVKKGETMKDQIIKFLAYDGKISVTCISTTNLVEKARIIHDLSPLTTAALGRVLTITALIGADMKNATDKLTIQIKGNGPIGKIVAVADSTPKVKACITNPQVELPLNEFGKLDVGGAIGNQGFINVIKDIGLKEPYIGISPLTSGEIAEDFANYFQTSEQKQTAVALGVLVDKNGVRASGGYIITPMPDATEEEISKVEKAIFEAGAISKMLDNNLTLKEIAQKVTGDKNIRTIDASMEPEYECECTKERFADGLMTIGKEQLKELIKDDGKAEIKCQFCNKVYNFNKEELEEIFERIGK